MSVATEGIEITRGDTYVNTLTILDIDGDPYDLTSATAWLTIKRTSDRGDDDDDAVIKLYWISGGDSSGMSVGSPTSGEVEVTISAALTDLLDPGRRYQYDVQVVKAGTVGTPVRGAVSVLGDITRRLTTP